MLEGVAIENWTGSYGNPKRILAAFCAGLLFAVGWWIIFDISSIYPSQTDFPHPYHTIGVFSSLALILIIAPKAEDNGGLLCTPTAARLLLFLGLLILFNCLIVAIWIMFQEYVIDDNRRTVWPGVGLFLQNLLISLSALTWKLYRNLEDEEYIPL